MKDSFLLVHGFMGSGVNWGAFKNTLQKKLNLGEQDVLAPDLLFHARNTAPDNKQFSNYLHAMTEDLLKAVENKLAIQPITVIAHSFGIRPVLRASQIKPKLFKKIYALDTSPTLSSKSHSFLSKILLDSPTPFASRIAAKEFFLKNFDSSMAAFFLSNIRKNSEGLQDWRFSKEHLLGMLQETKEQDLWTAWSEYKSPIISIIGKRSDHLSKETLKRLTEERKNPRNDKVYKLDTGHWVHSEAPVELAEIITKESKQNS